MKTANISVCLSKSLWARGNNASTKLKQAVEERFLKGLVGLFLFRRPYGKHNTTLHAHLSGYANPS